MTVRTFVAAALAVAIFGGLRDASAQSKPGAAPAADAPTTPAPAEAANPAAATTGDAPPPVAPTAANVDLGAETSQAQPNSDEPTDDSDESLEEPLLDDPEVELDGTLPGQIDTRSILSIYGFSDFTMSKYWLPEKSAFQAFTSRFAEFKVGRLNVYLRSDPAPRFTSLVQVRLLYLPNGGLEDTRSLDPISTAVLDTSELGQVVDWGGISIQRAWLQYDASPHFSIRAGHFLTPYGIWNIDHGSPIVIPVRRPFVITQQLFPESQTGIQALGSVELGDFQLGYRATAANGENPYARARDFQDAKALGGRLELVTPWLDELTIGLSIHGGRFTTRSNRIDQVNPESPANTTVESVVVESGKRLSTGADLRMRWRGLEINAEFVDRQIAYDDDGRPVDRLLGGELVADSHDYGGYAIVGYRTSWHGAMPFVQLEHMNFDGANLALTFGSVGVNVRLHPAVVLKAVVSRAWLDDSGGIAQYPTDDLLSFESQVAWVF